MVDQKQNHQYNNSDVTSQTSVSETWNNANAPSIDYTVTLEPYMGNVGKYSV